MSKRIIVVLGMHRSGTSVITRALKTLGVDLGENLLPPAPDVNDKGFWEDQEFNSINIELLKILGRDWHSNEPIPQADFDNVRVSPLKQQAVELLRRKIQPTGLFGVKDPRACVLLPFWKGVFGVLGVDASYVIAVRHPMSVAKSLKKRDGLEEIKSHYLWLSHMASSALESEGRPRVVVDYDLLMDQPETQLRRVADRLGLRPPPDGSAEMDEFKNEFLDTGLRHTRFQPDSPQLDAEMPVELIEAYGLFKKLARDELDLESPEVHETFARLNRSLDKFTSVLHYMDLLMAQRDTAVAERDAATAQKDFVTSQRDAALAERDEKEKAIDSLNSRITDIFQRSQPHSLEVFKMYRRNRVLERDVVKKSDLLSIILTRARKKLSATPETPDNAPPHVARLCGRFDEAAYLLANPDVLERVKSGEFSTGQEHWSAVGLGEVLAGKRVAGFVEHDEFYDEAVYLENNEDVDTLVRDGRFLSGYDHWLCAGLDEFKAGKRKPGFSVDPNAVRLNVVIFGTGEGGRLAKSAIAAKGWRVLRFVDNNPEMWGKIRFGLPVASPETLLKRDFELIIVASSVGRHAISEQLDGMGFKYLYDYASPLEIALIDGWDVVFHKNLKEWLVEKRKGESVSLDGRLTLPTSDSPLVSVVIPVHNQIEYTYKCLLSITKAPPARSFEVIVVDDASSDQTADVLSRVEGLRVVKNDKNLGFIRSCNKGASVARGEYLHFLNNDTEVLPGWLDELAGIFEKRPDAGLVGSMLIYPDGRLQEAGGIIWNNGSALNYGRHDYPEKPEYNYVREADYISGASIMIKKKLFDKLGRFDELYLPAYGEDADLAFAVRKAGYKVLYQPASQIIHYEGVTSGTDIKRGVKAYQVENARKFFDRWRDFLASNPDFGENIDDAKDRGISYRVLVLDHCTPTPDQDAGSVTVFNFMLLLQHAGFQVTFIPEDNFLYIPGYTSDLQMAGIETLYTPYFSSMKRHLMDSGSRYDLVFIFRPVVADRHLKLIRKLCPRAKVLYHTSDLHFLRMSREAELLDDENKRRNAEKMREHELSVMRSVDAVIVHSSMEKELLEKESPGAKVFTFQWAIPIRGSETGFDSRSNIAFVGGYQHPPNVDAVLYFVDKIFPLLRERIPGVRFYAIGSKPPKALLDLAGPDVVVTGFVEDLASLLDTMRVAVAPLRYGAGIKGKIGTTLSLALPCVGTTIAVEGMGLRDGEEILVADTPESFADAVTRLYNDKVLWEKISRQGVEFADREYGPSAAQKAMWEILDWMGFEPKPDSLPLKIISPAGKNAR